MSFNIYKLPWTMRKRMKIDWYWVLGLVLFIPSLILHFRGDNFPAGMDWLIIGTLWFLVMILLSEIERLKSKLLGE